MLLVPAPAVPPEPAAPPVPALPPEPALPPPPAVPPVAPEPALPPLPDEPALPPDPEVPPAPDAPEEPAVPAVPAGDALSSELQPITPQSEPNNAIEAMKRVERTTIETEYKQITVGGEANLHNSSLYCFDAALGCHHTAHRSGGACDGTGRRRAQPTVEFQGVQVPTGTAVPTEQTSVPLSHAGLNTAEPSQHSISASPHCA